MQIKRIAAHIQLEQRVTGRQPARLRDRINFRRIPCRDDVAARIWICLDCLDRLRYLILPLCGAATVAVLWLNLELSSLYLGLIWAALGLVWLAVRTSRFRKPLPQVEA